MNELRFRQVHLDFHTSEDIPGIGSEFDPDRFVATLKAAHVDSVTCFSRCHHGWIYHDTAFPNRHPHLTTNLLAEQIRACHAADIRVPIYITVGWDHLVAREHPEWIEIDEEGRQVGRQPKGKGYGWYNLDFASPYMDYVAAQTGEVMDLFGDEVDGVFFDIIFQTGVHSEACLRRFRQLGQDPADPRRQAEMRDRLVAECIDRLAGVVRGKKPDASLFFNSGHVGPLFRRTLGGFSHLEIESLPSGGWGYMHFPLTSRYARTLGLDFLGMTGKFSESWGHFNSYKNPAALEFECFSMLAQGGKCSVGDQLHPRGVLDPKTYELIGGVYAQVEAREPWCRGARAVTEIAVFNAEQVDPASGRLNPKNLGAARMLMEGRHQFDFVDEEADLSAYRVLILPEVAPAEGPFLAKVASFIQAGGALLAAGALPSWVFDLPGFPAASTGRDLPTSPDFVRWDGADVVMYERGIEVEAASGAEVLATVTEPYFERTWQTFCSHAHTPPDRTTDKPAILRQGRVACFCHPVFTTYAQHSMSLHREIVLAMLDSLLPEPILRASGPTSLQATVTRQGGRHVVHLLHYVPERRGLQFDIVEDRMPVHGVEVSVALPGDTATLQPQGVVLPCQRKEGRLRFVVPVVDGHQMVVVE